LDKELEKKINLQTHKYFWGYINDNYNSVLEAERIIGLEPNRLHVVKTQKFNFRSPTLFYYFNKLSMDMQPLQEELNKIIEDYHARITSN